MKDLTQRSFLRKNLTVCKVENVKGKTFALIQHDLFALQCRTKVAVFKFKLLYPGISSPTRDIYII